MNVVVCRHPGDNGKYIFMVPPDVQLEAGSLVHVETNRGVQPAQCLTASFYADGETVCPLWGTNPQKMKRVISVLLENYITWPDPPREEKLYDDDEEP